MTAKQMTKKDFAKKLPKQDDAHWEGKYFCDCRVRNKRKWFGVKKYGKGEEC